jgi:hypothetical protein
VKPSITIIKNGKARRSGMLDKRAAIIYIFQLIAKPENKKNPARMLGFLKSLTAKCSAVRVQSYKEIELETFCFDAS